MKIYLGKIYGENWLNINKSLEIVHKNSHVNSMELFYFVLNFLSVFGFLQA